MPSSFITGDRIHQQPLFFPGVFVAAPISADALTTLVMTSGAMYLTPFYCPRHIYVSELGIKVVGAATGTATLRLGIYDTANLGVGAMPLISPAGSSLTATSTGYKSHSWNGTSSPPFAVRLVPGFYLLAALATSTATLPTVQAASGDLVGQTAGGDAAIANRFAGFGVTGQSSGNLPALIDPGSPSSDIDAIYTEVPRLAIKMAVEGELPNV